MSNTTVRISDRASRTLRELAARTGETMQSVLDRAIEDYRRQRFFEEMNAAYAALRDDPAAWQEEQEERATWDATLMDGFAPDERWAEDGAMVEGNKVEKGRGRPLSR